MPQSVRIQMMGAFAICVNGETMDYFASRSRKGVSLVEYLILHEGKRVSNQRLIREFWPGQLSVSPETSLKTLVSRTRSLLNEAMPGLGGCIVSENGGYRWQNLPEMETDAAEIIRITALVKGEITPQERQTATRRLLELYRGDLFLTGDMADGMSLSGWLHREYLDAVYLYLDQLRAEEAYNEICDVCAAALRVDELDENLHMERMKALVNLNRPSDAMGEYRSVMRNSLRYLDTEPSEDMQTLYRQISQAGQEMRFNLDAIRNELMEEEPHPSPFICDYQTFKEIYHLQMRNLERVGTTMSLGVIMVGSGGNDESDAVARESAMAGLMQILRQSLRRGDIVTRFSPSIVAMLLPTVNYANGGIVMERIEQLFRAQYPAENVPFYYRVSYLGGSPS